MEAYHAPPAFAFLAPELTNYLAGFSKTQAPGLRVAYLGAPHGRIGVRLAVKLRRTTIGDDIACYYGIGFMLDHE